MHNDQRLQQLQTKFEEERSEQQTELNRAMESKLDEQKQLIQKGFDEKAELMGLELEQLKKEKDELSRSFYKDYVVPGMEIAKELVLLYKSFKL